MHTWLFLFYELHWEVLFTAYSQRLAQCVPLDGKQMFFKKKKKINEFMIWKMFAPLKRKENILGNNKMPCCPQAFHVTKKIVGTEKLLEILS